MTKESFIDYIGSMIREEGNRRGYEKVSAIVAQACLEGGFGSSQLAHKYHNHFGLKSGAYWKGQSVNLKTGEVINGAHVIIRDNFRVFKDDEQGVKGYFDFISTKRYSNLREASKVGPRTYLEKIKEDGYATSPIYVEKCMEIVSQYNLTKFDGETQPQVSQATQQKPSIDTVAKQVIRGLWGNGRRRKELLEGAGYSYREVQNRVNELLKR